MPNDILHSGFSRGKVFRKETGRPPSPPLKVRIPRIRFHFFLFLDFGFSSKDNTVKKNSDEVYRSEEEMRSATR